MPVEQLNQIQLYPTIKIKKRKLKTNRKDRKSIKLFGNTYYIRPQALKFYKTIGSMLMGITTVIGLYMGYIILYCLQ